MEASEEYNQLQVIVKDYISSVRKEKVFNEQLTSKQFNKLDVIGGGQYAQIWRASRQNSDMIYAIKEINSDKISEISYQAFVECEVYLSEILLHPNIVTCYGHYLDKGNVNLVQEFCPKGNLHGIMNESGKFSEADASKIVYQIASALAECHSQGFLHGDVKTENILMADNGNVKLCDFGLSWPKGLGSARGQVGTLEYLAPEILRGDDYDETIDSWALGILCCELLFGKSPFPKKKKNSIRWHIAKAHIKIPADIDLSKQALDFIYSLVKKDAQSRLSMDDVMSHEWILNWRETWAGESA